MKQFLRNISPFNSRTEMPVILCLIKIILAFFLCKFAGELLAEGAVILLHLAVGKNVLEGEMFDPQTITLITYYGYIIVIAVTLLYWKLFQKKPLSEMGITKQFRSYFAGAAAGAVLVVLSAAVILMTGAIRYGGIFQNIDFAVILLMFGGFAVQGAMEEILCRGLVLHALRQRISVPAAVAVSTVLFILPHWPALSEGAPLYAAAGVLNLILISVIFSLLTLRFESIWAACGLHTVWNFILYNIMGLNLSGNDQKTAAVFDLQTVGENLCNGAAYGIEASILTAAVLSAAALLLWLTGRKSLKATPHRSGGAGCLRSKIFDPSDFS